MAVAERGAEVAVERLEAAAFTIPTDSPESDGTAEWNETTLVVCEVAAGGERGLGYTYSHTAAAALIEDLLAPEVIGRDALDTPATWRAMAARVRNVGRPGLASTAISAIDAALWDVRARLAGVPLVALLGRAHEQVDLYASGGFTSYGLEQLNDQLAGWADRGFRAVKIKVGREPERDADRVAAARSAIGEDVELFVDANGAYSRKQALGFAELFAEQGVIWFEEPVSSEDLEGLRLLRDRAPARIEIAAGEYGYGLHDFRRLLEAGAVDCLQADATRCGGITGFLAVASLCLAYGIGLSAHTAPALHLHACCAALPLRHLEWFHDHVRIERMLFDGAQEPVGGALLPDLSRPGLGLELRRADAERFRVR